MSSGTVICAFAMCLSVFTHNFIFFDTPYLAGITPIPIEPFTPKDNLLSAVIK
jgi:hypothetical protein